MSFLTRIKRFLGSLVTNSAILGPTPSGVMEQEMAHSPDMKSWRLKVFTSTWLTYFGFYFCRKAFYAVKGPLSQDLMINETQLGYIGFAYLLCYTIGQFTSVASGRLLGARNLLLVGMAASVVTNVVFGFAANVWTIMAFMAINGFAQATGWPSVVGSWPTGPPVRSGAPSWGCGRPAISLAVWLRRLGRRIGLPSRGGGAHSLRLRPC